MGFVYTLVVEPMGQRVGREVDLRVMRKWQVGFNQPPELFERSIDKAPPLPLMNDATVVKPKGVWIFPPHVYRRMVLPAVVRVEYGVENLEVFNALLTKPLVVEDRCRAVVAGQRQESLHGI